MRLLILDQFDEIGGAQRGILDLLPAFQDRGWKCALATPGEGPFVEAARRLGTDCRHFRFPELACGGKHANDYRNFAFAFAGARRDIAGLIAQVNPDVLYINGPRILPVTATLTLRARVLFHAHSYLRQRSAAALAGLALRRLGAHIVGNSRYALQPLAPYVPSSNTEVVYNGVQERPFRNRTFPGFRIGVIGRICPDKGQHTLIEAARLVRREFPACRFVVCGAPQFHDLDSVRYEQRLKESADEAVEFTGWQQDIGVVLDELDMLVAPSAERADTTPRVMVEAASAGVPVIASDLPGIREILDDGRAGFLFPAGDANSLAALIIALLKDPQRLSQIVNLARLRYEQHFALDLFQRRMINILESVAGSERAWNAARFPMRLK